MAALARPTVHRCSWEQLLRQQTAQTPMSALSASFPFIQRAANGSDASNPPLVTGAAYGGEEPNLSDAAVCTKGDFEVARFQNMGTKNKAIGTHLLPFQ